MEKIEYFCKLEDMSDLIKFSNFSTLNSENSNFVFNMIELFTRKYKYINNNFKTFQRNLILLEKEIYKIGKDSGIFEEYLEDKDKQEVKKYKLDKKKSDITPTSIGKIHIIIAAPNTGLNKKLNWKTFTCGAVFEITPSIISCPNVASSTGDAICKPTYNTFEVVFIR